MNGENGSYLDLAFAHDLVHDLIVVLVEHAFVVTLLVAEDSQVLGALQFNLKLLCNNTKAVSEDVCMVAALNAAQHKGEGQGTDLVPQRLGGVSEDSGLGFADKVAERVHFQSAI